MFETILQIAPAAPETAAITISSQSALSPRIRLANQCGEEQDHGRAKRREQAVVTRPVPSARRFVPGAAPLGSSSSTSSSPADPKTQMKVPCRIADVVEDGEKGREDDQQGQLPELRRRQEARHHDDADQGEDEADERSDQVGARIAGQPGPSAPGPGLALGGVRGPPVLGVRSPRRRPSGAGSERRAS